MVAGRRCSCTSTACRRIQDGRCEAAPARQRRFHGQGFAGGRVRFEGPISGVAKAKEACTASAPGRQMEALQADAAPYCVAASGEKGPPLRTAAITKGRCRAGRPTTARFVTTTAPAFTPPAAQSRTAILHAITPLAACRHPDLRPRSRPSLRRNRNIASHPEKGFVDLTTHAGTGSLSPACASNDAPTHIHIPPHPSTSTSNVRLHPPLLSAPPLPCPSSDADSSTAASRPLAAPTEQLLPHVLEGPNQIARLDPALRRRRRATRPEPFRWQWTTTTPTSRTSSTPTWE